MDYFVDCLLHKCTYVAPLLYDDEMSLCVSGMN
jgi:hypothetical protein